ncbi:MAG: hypothetical protein K0R92_131 [Lachnospiraceae bacterium]|jgi:uncharacterized membrane protein|nr:hypothetical protein [Lachnospiraceae bacterium]
MYRFSNIEDNNLMKKNFYSNFLLCGLSGWCMECFWTGVHSILGRKDRSLSCHTSVWMFPIYGLAACLNPIAKKLKDKSALLRGGVYTICIFSTEFFTGKVLKKFGACPWDYSKAKLNYKGIIRFDFAPAWFLVGLFYEKLLGR